MTRQEIDALYRKYAPMVHRRAAAILRSDDEATEATQEVFIRALTGAEAFEARSAPSTWLYRITTNWCLKRIRDGRRRRELWEQHVAPPEGAAEPSTDDPTHLVLMRNLLAEADPREASAAIYVYVDGLSHEEAAELLGVSRRTAGNLCDRFVEFGRKHLAAGAGAR